MKGNEKLLKKFEQYTNEFKKTMSNPSGGSKPGSRYSEHDELLRIRNATATTTKTTTRATTTTTTTASFQQRPKTTTYPQPSVTAQSAASLMHTTTTTKTTPLLYILNINDTYSKALLNNIKSKDNRLNILIKKPPAIVENSAVGQPKIGQLVVDTNLLSHPFSSINNNNNNNNNINPSGVMMNSIVKNKIAVTTPFPFNQLNPVILNKDKSLHPQITTRYYYINHLSWREILYSFMLLEFF